MMSLYLGILLLYLQLAVVDGRCTFPQEWHGHWHQGGLGDVIIRDNTISKKGVCRKHKGDYYLVESRRENCFQCLLMMRRHRNLIQYKESYCLGKASLDAICEQIRVEAILYTLVREPSHPVGCPFQEAFHFQFNNNTGGWCRHPVSYMQPCSGGTRYQFRFQHCQDAAYTHRRDVDYDCLATWKEGSDTYMYGKLIAPGFKTKDEKYRCFMYQVLGTLVYLAMSADATCRGLRSPKDGPVVMELTQDTFGWPQTNCEFPAWLTEYSWRDLSGIHVFRTDNRGRTLQKYHRRKHDGTLHPQSSFRCIQIMTGNTTARQFVGVSFTSHGCSTHYQCVRLMRRDDSVLEIHVGRSHRRQIYQCIMHDFANATKALIIPDSLGRSPCPFTGKYHMESPSQACHTEFHSGCNGTGKMDIVTTCVMEPVVHLECLHTWQEKHRDYVIARRADKLQGSANCFSFRRKGGKVIFVTDKRCNLGAPYILTNTPRYTFKAQPDKCSSEDKKVPRSGPDSLENKIDKENKDIYRQIDEHSQNEKMPLEVNNQGAEVTIYHYCLGISLIVSFYWSIAEL